MSEELKISADVGEFEKGKDKVNAGFKSMEKAAEQAATTGAKSMDKLANSAKRAAQSAQQAASRIQATASGGGGTTIIGGGGRSGGGRRGGINTIIGGLGAGRGSLARKGAAIAANAVRGVAGRAAGSIAGRVVGGTLGSVVPGLGTAAGAVAGGALGNMIFGGGGKGDDSAMPDGSAERIQQLVNRGIKKQQAAAIDLMSRNVEAKFKIDANRVTGAVFDAHMGKNNTLAGLMEDVGIRPDSVGGVNDALSRLNAVSAGASKKPAPVTSKIGAALERLGSTPQGTFASSYAKGVWSAPGEMLGNVASGAASAGRATESALVASMDRLTAALGGSNVTAPAIAGGPGTPRLDNDSSLLKQKAAKRGRGELVDVRVTFPKSAAPPTITRNSGGR